MAVNKKIPLRICVGCGENKEKKSMLRVIKTSDDKIHLDDTCNKNGRGAYICKTAECLEKAVKNKGLERSLKVKIPQEIYEQLQKEMEKYDTR